MLITLWILCAPSYALFALKVAPLLKITHVLAIVYLMHAFDW